MKKTRGFPSTLHPTPPVCAVFQSFSLFIHIYIRRYVRTYVQSFCSPPLPYPLMKLFSLLETIIVISPSFGRRQEEFEQISRLIWSLEFVGGMS